MTTGDPPDLIEVLMTDHREVEAFLAELSSGAGDPDHRKRLTDVAIAVLVRHSVAEEMYLYPTAKRALPDGEQLGEHEIRAHAEAEVLMNRIDGLDATDPEFEPTVARLVVAVRQHVRDEESDLFPRLRQACTPAELLRLGGKVEAVKKVAPTRPHPAAPDHPPLNKLVAPVAGLVDRVRDALTNRPTSADDL
jgi:hemerythrin superfamily protein